MYCDCGKFSIPCITKSCCAIDDIEIRPSTIQITFFILSITRWLVFKILEHLELAFRP